MLKILSQDKNTLIIVGKSSEFYIQPYEGIYFVDYRGDKNIPIELGEYHLLREAECALEGILMAENYYIMP